LLVARAVADIEPCHETFGHPTSAAEKPVRDAAEHFGPDDLDTISQGCG
jgi:hypothetical protein